MATSPCQETGHAKQEADIIGTSHVMMEEIKVIQEGQKSTALLISLQIDIGTKQLREELKSELTTRMDCQMSKRKMNC